MTNSYDNWVSNPKENHGPLMSITAWSLVGAAGGFLLLRLCVRQSQGKLWLDDLVLGISWLLLLSQVIINQLTINLGFGKHSLDIDFTHLERIAYYGASALSISILAITLSKIAFGVTLLRLTDGWARSYVNFAMTTLFVFAIPVAVIPWVQCKPLAKTFVDIIPGKCINKEPSVQFGRFQAGWAAIMDISLALLPWKILWGLQMCMAEKIGVCMAMSLGILAGAASLIRARYIELLTKQDLSYDAYNSVVWSLADTAMTIVATSIPILRVFFRKAVNSAIEAYSNLSSRGKSRSEPSRAASAGAETSLRQSTKRTTDTVETCSREFLGDRLGRGSKGYLELEELVVNESTGRITVANSELGPDAIEHKTPQRPL